MTDDDLIELGSALAVLRRKAGLTQVEAGAAVGISGNHVSAVENGERGVSYQTMVRLLRVYGSSLRELGEEIQRGGA